LHLFILKIPNMERLSSRRLHKDLDPLIASGQIEKLGGKKFERWYARLTPNNWREICEFLFSSRSQHLFEWLCAKGPPEMFNSTLSLFLTPCILRYPTNGPLEVFRRALAPHIERASSPPGWDLSPFKLKERLESTAPYISDDQRLRLSWIF